MKLDKCYVIPARAGSKGINGKNTIDLNGKMLFEWSVYSALKNLNRYDRIYISTNCEKIIKWYENNIMNNPSDYISEKVNLIIRPDHLCLDDSSTESALLHLYYELNNKGIELDDFVLLQPTSPFRLNDIIKKCVSAYNDNNKRYTVFTASKNTPFNWIYSNDKYAFPSYDYANRKRRQDLLNSEYNYHEDGNVYVFSSYQIVEYNNRMTQYSIPVENSKINSIQIDCEEEYNICKLIANTNEVSSWLQNIQI